MTSGCTAGPIGPATTTNLVPGDSPTQRGGSRRNFAKKNRCPISGRPTDLLFSRRFFSPEAQSVTDPPNRFSELPFPFSRARHTIPPPNTEAASERRPSHSRIFSRPHSQPPNSARQSHPHDESTTDRPVVTALLRQGFACRRPPACDLPGGIGQPNQTLAKSGSGWVISQSRLNLRICIGVRPHFFPRWRGKGDVVQERKKKKVSKRLSRARALVDSLFCCCFCFGLFLLHIPPPFVCFAVVLLYQLYLSRVRRGGSSTERLVAVASSGGMG